MANFMNMEQLWKIKKDRKMNHYHSFLIGNNSHFSLAKGCPGIYSSGSLHSFLML